MKTNHKAGAEVIERVFTDLWLNFGLLEPLQRTFWIESSPSFMVSWSFELVFIQKNILSNNVFQDLDGVFDTFC